MTTDILKTRHRPDIENLPLTALGTNCCISWRKKQDFGFRVDRLNTDQRRKGSDRDSAGTREEQAPRKPNRKHCLLSQ
jgi:hypothetical protein